MGTAVWVWEVMPTGTKGPPVRLLCLLWCAAFSTTPFFSLPPAPRSTSGDVLRNLGGMGAHGMRLTAERVLKYGFGLSLLGVIPLTVIPLHNTFAPWLALCSPAYRAAAAKQVDAGVSVPPAAVLSPLQGSLLTTAILGGWVRGGGGVLLVCRAP